MPTFSADLMIHADEVFITRHEHADFDVVTIESRDRYIGMFSIFIKASTVDGVEQLAAELMAAVARIRALPPAETASAATSYLDTQYEQLNDLPVAPASDALTAQCGGS
jgi:hypothetical protein